MTLMNSGVPAAAASLKNPYSWIRFTPGLALRPFRASLMTLVLTRYMIAEACVDALEVCFLAYTGHAGQDFGERFSTRLQQSLR